MVTRNTTNAVPNVTTATIKLPDMLRHVIVTGRAARTAALELCYSAAAYLLLVNHFQDTKSKEYMTRADAKAFLMKELAQQAGVKGGMLDLYIRNADKLASILTGSIKMFSPVIQRIGKAETPADATKELADWADANLLTIHGSGERQTSMRQLSEALGFSTGRPSNTPKLTADNPEKVRERITNTIKTIEKLVTEGTGEGEDNVKLPARVVTAGIAQAIPQTQALSLAREAVKRIVDADDLKALETAIADQRKVLAKLADKAKDTAKAKAKGASKPAPRNARPATASVAPNAGQAES